MSENGTVTATEETNNTANTETTEPTEAASNAEDISYHALETKASNL